MKTLRIAAVALIGLLTVLPPPAYTGLLRCRSDPAVLLSNGTLVDLSADIDAMLWDVKSVNYTLYVPAGLRAILVIRTPSWPTTKETFKIVANQAPKVYDSTTIVYTKRTGTGVTANLLVSLSFASARGWDRQLLKAGVTTR